LGFLELWVPENEILQLEYHLDFPALAHLNCPVFQRRQVWILICCEIFTNPSFKDHHHLTTRILLNVLVHGKILKAIKEYNDWPTIPQLYIKGEFIGGCDIVTSMYKDGELEKMLKEHKLLE